MTLSNARIAVYAGTFDPMTWGHIDIIKRGSALFDRVVVAVAESQHKKTLFQLAERVALAKTVLESYHNVSVEGFDTLTLDFATAHHATILIRGIRAVADFDYEFQLANMNRALAPHIETVFLMPSQQYMFVSSSLIREIASLKGDITPFVPKPVADALCDKLK